MQVPQPSLLEAAVDGPRLPYQEHQHLEIFRGQLAHLKGTQCCRLAVQCSSDSLLHLRHLPLLPQDAEEVEEEEATVKAAIQDDLECVDFQGQRGRRYSVLGLHVQGLNYNLATRLRKQ